MWKTSLRASKVLAIDDSNEEREKFVINFNNSSARRGF